MDRFVLHVWKSLAMREDLPEQAVPSVVAALTRPAVPDMSGHTQWVSQSQQETLGRALPNLLAKTQDPAIRAQVIAAAPRPFVEAAVLTGTVTGDDLDAAVSAHGVWADLVLHVAKEPGRLSRALELLQRLSGYEAISVVVRWGKESPVPAEIVDVLAEQALAPVVEVLADPASSPGWKASRVTVLYNDWPCGHSGNAWLLLQEVPQHWERLLAHPELGTATAHVLLDSARELPEAVLAACAPFASAPELGRGLPEPRLVARHRLHKMASRVQRFPALLDLAGDDLAEAADWCVRKGRLLARGRGDKWQHSMVPLVKDLAQVSGSAKQLTKALELVMELAVPTVLLHETRTNTVSGEVEVDSPGRRLERNLQHQRVQALAALAGNPCCDHTPILDAVADLHPAEQDWLARTSSVPAWLRQAAGAALPESEDELAVPRMVSDDDLDLVPDPQAVLQSWLKAAATELSLDSYAVYNRVLASRHLTQDVLRQVPYREVLGAEGTTRDALLIALCGTDPARWAVVEQALEDRSIDRDHRTGREPFAMVMDLLEPLTQESGNPA